MATFDITVPAGSGVGGTGTGAAAFTTPSDFDGAFVDDVSVIDSPIITSDGQTDDTIGIRWRIQTDGGVAIWGDYGAVEETVGHASIGNFAPSGLIGSGAFPSPAQQPAVADDWDEIAYNANYTANMMSDGETVSWDSFTVRVTYTPADIQQEHYRFATPITGADHEAYPLVGSEDASFEIVLDVDYCLIVKLGNDGADAAFQEFQLEYNVDGAGWNDVNAASLNVRTVASGDFDNSTSSTERLTASARTFDVSALDEADGKSLLKILASDEEIEFYYAITFRSADLSGGEVITFRVTAPVNPVTLDITPTATVPSAGNNITGAGAIPSLEAIPTDAVVALSTRQTISGTVGGISSLEALPTDAVLANVPAQAISGTVGGIASLEAVPTDATITKIVGTQTIAQTVGLVSLEAVPTDAVIANVSQAITGITSIASLEAVPTDAVLALSVRQSITGTVGGITSLEAVPTDAVVANVSQLITGITSISSAEAIPTDHQVASPSQDIISAGAIPSLEAVPTDLVLALAARQTIIGTVGGIASLEAVPTDAVFAQPAQGITGTVGAIASLEAVPTDAVVEIPAVLQTITISNGITSLEAVPTDAIFAQPTQGITGITSIPSAEAIPTDAVLALTARQIITGITSIPTAEAVPTDLLVTELQTNITAAGGITSAEVVPSSLTVGVIVLDNPAAFFSHGTTIDVAGSVHAVSVGRTFGGGVGDVHLAGTRHTVNGAMYVTFDSPVGGEPHINGILHTISGIRFVVDSSAINKWPEGFSIDSGGIQASTTIVGGFSLRAIARTSDGRMVIDL